MYSPKLYPCQTVQAQRPKGGIRPSDEDDDNGDTNSKPENSYLILDCSPEAQKPKTFQIATFTRKNFPDEARETVSRDKPKKCVFASHDRTTWTILMFIRGCS